MSKSFNKLQYSGVWAEMSAGAAFMIWPDQLWIAYVLFAGGLVLIFWPFYSWAKTIHVSSPFHNPIKDPKQELKTAPQISTGTGKHDVWLLDASHYIVTRDWNAPKILMDDNRLDELYQSQQDIRQVAVDGDLPIWGMNNFAGPLIEIDKEYWKLYGKNE